MTRMSSERVTTRLVSHGEPVLYFTFSGLAALGLPHATTTRHFPGVTSPSQPTAPFDAAARGALGTAGLDLSRVAFARQVHGADALRAPTGGGWAGAGDVLTTTERGVPLAIFTADCLAITLWDSIARVLTVAHVGWRGTVRGATGAAVRAAVEAGARAGQLHAAIGPSIGPCCYEVDAPVVEPLRAAFPGDWTRWATARGPGKWWLDLWQANTDQLAAAGVRADAILNPRLCTACRRDLFFSYRREGPGRSLATIAVLD
jgi:YfiH family protein